MFYCLSSPLLAPLFIGLYLVFQPARLKKFAGWYTLKPVITTPLLFAVLFQPDTLPEFEALKYFPVLLGVALSLMIIWLFRDLYFGENREFFVFVLLVALDVLRWGSALSCVIFLDRLICFSDICDQLELGPLLLLAALGFPTLFAIVALRQSSSAIQSVWRSSTSVRASSPRS